MIGMKRTGQYILLSLFWLSTVEADNENFIPAHFSHSCQTYYLEDYCGPQWKTACTPQAHTVHINATGDRSAAIIRGFRTARTIVKRNLKCCIIIKTLNFKRLHVQLDQAHLKKDKLRADFVEQLRFHEPQEEFGDVHREIETSASFKTLRNVLKLEYAISPENTVDFEKIEMLVTSATGSNTSSGIHCSTTAREWQCDDGSCIWEGFRCDGYNNCGDWSDEFYCGSFLSYYVIFLAISSVACLALVMYCVCITCWRRKNQMPSNKPFQFVSSLGPNGQSIPQQKVYPSLEVPYQNSLFVPNVRGGAPPIYRENTLLGPSSNPSYGATLKC